MQLTGKKMSNYHIICYFIILPFPNYIKKYLHICDKQFTLLNYVSYDLINILI